MFITNMLTTGPFVYLSLRVRVDSVKEASDYAQAAPRPPQPEVQVGPGGEVCPGGGLALVGGHQGTLWGHLAVI